MKVLAFEDDGATLDLVAHFLGIATHHNVNAAPAATAAFKANSETEKQVGKTLGSSGGTLECAVCPTVENGGMYARLRPIGAHGVSQQAEHGCIALMQPFWVGCADDVDEKRVAQRTRTTRK